MFPSARRPSINPITGEPLFENGKSNGHLNGHNGHSNGGTPNGGTPNGVTPNGGTPNGGTPNGHSNGYNGYCKYMIALRSIISIKRFSELIIYKRIWHEVDLTSRRGFFPEHQIHVTGSILRLGMVDSAFHPFSG